MRQDNSSERFFINLQDPIEEQSLIKDVSENQDQQWDNEYKAKKKKKKFYLNKKRRKQNERGKYEKMRVCKIAEIYRDKFVIDKNTLLLYI